jgi:hypothetical protein
MIPPRPLRDQAKSAINDIRRKEAAESAARSVANRNRAHAPRYGVGWLQQWSEKFP